MVTELQIFMKFGIDIFQNFNFLNINKFVIFILFYVIFSWPCHMAYGILVPQPGIEPSPLALESQNVKHWTFREVLKLSNFIDT